MSTKPTKRSAAKCALHRAGLTGALVALSLGLSGCWEEVTEHTPGVYAGKADPLTSSDDAAAQRTETLAKRFQLVQTDR